MALLLECRNICMEYGDDIILKDINLYVKEGEKLAIAGSNGGGKTTLVNIICGLKEPTSGMVIFHCDNADIGYMRQSYDFSDDGKVSQMSCGEKTKKVFNNILYGKHDVLILDEPTNHLDYEGVEYIIRKINDFKGTVIMIFHDRYFLDKCAERIIELENGAAHEYEGNYSFYRKVKQEEYENTLKLYNEQEKVKAKINNEIVQTKNWSSKAHKEARKKAIETGNKFGGKEFNRAKAKRMDKQVKSRIKRLEKIKTDGIVKPQEEAKVFFQLNQARTRGNIAVYGKDVSKSYESNIIFQDSSFYIRQGEKAGLFGKNGCGKSTLIKALLGETDFDGELYLSKSGTVGYLSQDVIDLDEGCSIIDFFEADNNKDMGIIRTKLDLLGFHGDAIYKKAGCLSMGERMKVKLLLMIQKNCGTLLLVTHDRYMMEKICDKLLVFKDKRIARYEYGLEEYLKSKEKSSGISRDKSRNTEEKKMLLESRISCVLSALCMCSQGSREYKELEKEYNELLKQKNM
ncbi:ABC-F family ATP-binding cassette domain-containing protein [uncultured Clostridium sp.]|uniref:ABC-F family ATP-binding cassette domain-containing protein n=1 Tax=uncultured Clostridium sp. TaxID=59620 RepID=UPI0025D6E5E6|nr:ATP-binding cassette domain-containing protein [uncultured Clostridium sp.]